MAKLELSRDWKEFLGALISRNVKFLLVGGHAIAIHGNPRLTEDLDVFSEPTLENGNKLRAALVDFGFGSVAPTAEKLAEAAEEKFSAPSIFVNLGLVTFRHNALTLCRVNFFFFQELYRRDAFAKALGCVDYLRVCSASSV